MKLVALLAGFLIAGFGSCSLKAQTLNSPNLIGSPYSTPTGTTAYTGTGGGYSGGSTPGYNSTTNTIHFGYTQSTVAYTYAFSQALQNSGMTILGYNYSWNYLNQGDSIGTLSARVNFAGVDGTSLHQKNWTLGQTTNWTTVSGTETFANSGLTASSIANLSLSFSGKDSRFWAGYYGPQVKDPSLSLNYTFDQCSSNPLSSPTCPGYAAAYQTQQCTINALYNSACPGYAVAYQIQQCTINPLTDPSCPGYAAAYLTQQCRVNPLYSTVCEGYQTAYHDQQCGINPLFASDCIGYATAYKTQQCTTSPLYATDCPSYDQAYLNSQCIRDSLYSNKCEGYATAYAIKNLIKFSDSTVSSSVNQSLSNTAAVKANDPSNTVVPTNTASTTVSIDGTVSTGVSATGDTNVDKAITSKASSTNATPTAVQLAPPAPAPQQQMAQGGNNKQEDKKDDAPKGTGGGPSPQNTGNTQSSSDKPAAPTARQELQARREAAAKAEAVEKGKNLANEMGKAADMESQKQIQNVVIQAMGFTPGFDTYSKAIMNDVVGYKPYSIYNNQKTIDNRANLRMFGGSDRLHNDMVESQYKLKKED